jgi:pimeloyl-ACP methyl ester carboxylesterase
MAETNLPSIIIGKLGSFPLDEALQPIEKQPFIDTNAESSAIQRTWAAFSGDPERLDLGDVFQALVEPYLFGNLSEIKDKLKIMLGYRPGDPLTFKTLALSPSSQVALTIIEPGDRNSDTPVLIFATGFAHPASLYVPHLQGLAREMRTKVVVFDLPGNGGSQSNGTVDQRHFYQALKAVITFEVPEGGHYFVGGHSLGSAPVYQLFQDIKQGKTPVGNRTLARAVVVNPIPSRHTETSGNAAISRGFMTRGVLSEVAHGLTALKANSFSLFDNDLPDKISGRPIIAREEVPISVPGMIKIYGSIDMNDPALEVGTDPRIAVVLSRSDRLMNWDHNTFNGRRGYHVIDGDHGACLTGTQLTFACTAALMQAFTEPLNPHERILPPRETYRHINSMVRMGIQAGIRTPSTVVTPEIATKYGIISFGQSLGIYLGAGIAGELGYRFGQDSRGTATSLGMLHLGVEGLRLPIDIKFGAQAGVDFLNPSDYPIVSALTVTVGANVARIIDIEAQARFSMTGQFQDVVAGLKLRLN